MHNYIWFINEHDEGQPYGWGLAHCLYSLAYIKSKVIQYGASLCERFAEPWLKAKLDIHSGILADNVLGAQFSSIASRVQEYLDILEKMRARHILVQSNEDEIETQEAGGSSFQIISSFLEYLDKAITTYILGASLSTQSDSGHSFAQAETHQTSTDAQASYVQFREEETFTRGLVDEFISRNWVHFLHLGMPTSLKYKIKTQAKTQADIRKRREGTQLALEKSITIKKSELYETLGYSIPQPDDDIFIARPSFQPTGTPGGVPGLPFFRTPENPEIYQKPWLFKKKNKNSKRNFSEMQNLSEELLQI
jgi:hypothetical protein